jgi:hypothetical protein
LWAEKRAVTAERTAHAYVTIFETNPTSDILSNRVDHIVAFSEEI